MDTVVGKIAEIGASVVQLLALLVYR